MPMVIEPTVLKFLLGFFVLSTVALGSPIIPIEDEVLLTMQLQADSVFDLIVETIVANSGVIDTASLMRYTGRFSIFPGPGDTFTGSYSGMLSGDYLSDLYNIQDAGTFSGDALTYTVTSSGEWGKDDNVPKELRGKKFTATGTLIENKDTLDSNVTVTTPDAENKDLKCSLKKTTKRNTVKGKGDCVVPIPDNKENKETVTIQLDTQKNTATSNLYSGPPILGVTVLTNTGTFVVSEGVGGQKSGSLSFDLTTTTIPEARMTWPLLLGIALFSFMRYRRPRRLSRQN